MEPFAATTIKYKLVNDEIHETPMSVYTYSDKSVALTVSEHFGKAFTEQLKELGKYNPKLKEIGKGWIFAVSRYTNLQQLIGKISNFEIRGEIPVVYTKTAINKDFFVNVNTPPEIIGVFNTLISKLQDTTVLNTVETPTDKYVYGPTLEVQKYLHENPSKYTFRFDTDEKTIIKF